VAIKVSDRNARSRGPGLGGKVARKPGKTPVRTSGKSARKTATGRAASARKRIDPARSARGLVAADVLLAPDAPEVAALAGEVRDAGGVVLAAYREPLAGRPLLLASLPREAVVPTPFQRDLSPTHAKKLAQKIDEAGAYLDPIIVVRGREGGFWTPNGRHRLAAAKVLGLRLVTALVSPDEALAFRILALNTEKAHNLRDRALEVVRMAEALAKQSPRARESDFAAQFESPELLTLGLVYADEGRFAGAAYAPFLRRLDRFGSETLPAALRRRRGLASRLVAIERETKRIVEALQARGFKSPYLRSYVVARINPVRFHRPKKGDTKPPMPIEEGLTRMLAAAKKFDLTKVRAQDLALVAAVAPDPD
jgi:ParB family transcriptional regulator, chromosome partitioning protein